MLKKIALALVVIVAAVLLYATTRPSAFTVARSVTVQAPPAKILPFITDFHRWQAWSPYEDRDPAMTRRYEGAASGPGAVYLWSGNGQVGAGRMEIRQVDAPGLVVIQLDFTAPIEGHNEARFTLVPAGAGTEVTWRMSGPSPYVARLMGIFFDMDKMIGGDFEAGLSKLKSAAEKA